MIRSPLGQLRATVRQVVESARTHRATLSQNEAFTRMALVDKVLAALGWDLSDSSMVIVEYQSPNVGRLDYALFGPASPGTVNPPVAIVEAKRLGGSLQDNYHQIIAYAIGAHLDNVFLTDGVVWMHYLTPFTGQDSCHRMDLGQPDPSADVAYLMHVLDAALFWPDEQEEDVRSRIRELENRLRAMEDRLEAATPREEPPPSQRTPGDSRAGTPPPERDTPPRPTLTAQVGIPVSQLTSEQVTKAKPRAVVLPDGTEITARTWKDFLVACADYALHHAQQPLPLPFGNGKKRYLLNSQPTHPGGNRMFAPATVSTPRGSVFVETHQSAVTAVGAAVRVLRWAGVAEPVVRLEP